MASGTLEVTGTIALDQFWPNGLSDADTAKIHLTVGADAFRFRPNDNAPFAVTHAFDDATVVGRFRSPTVNNGRITVRLQGIDAPELHYRPRALQSPGSRTAAQHELYLQWNEEYRQNLAETGTVRLAEKLQLVGQDPVPCTLVTAVDAPDEVFDCYGRFIGDIHVSVGGADVNLNTWLVEQGWAFPAFYNSMSGDEIQTLIDATDAAYAAQRGVWPYLTDHVGAEDGPLDWDMWFRRPSSNPVLDPVADADYVVFPKLFRRLSVFEVNQRAFMFTGTFMDYLRMYPDQCYFTADFLAQGTAATVQNLHDYMDASGYFFLWPEQIVFLESASRLVGPDGQEVDW